MMKKVPRKEVSGYIGHVFTVAACRYIAPSAGGASSCSWSFESLDSNKAQHSIQSLSHEFELATVFTLPKDDRFRVTIDCIRQQVIRYNEVDDVFHNDFLATVVFQGIKEDVVTISDYARHYLHELGTKRIICVESETLLPGPYALVGGQLRDAWKLIDDINGTSMVTLKPQSKASDAFESFPLKSTDDQFSSFALQSRIKTQARSDLPLAGIRILVKDNIYLKGIKTSVGNRAFYDTYPPRQESAKCIQQLIDKGVAVVGTTKMNSLANWEESIESIDYPAPWNPRADRYQSPGGSSSGSAAAVSTYDWLDIAIGTDTWGSVTRPALWCGCYGLRPSTGAVSAHGIEPCCKVYDTAGILGKDLQKCRDFAAEWLSPAALQKRLKPFASIIWPVDFWKCIDSNQIAIAQDFVKQMKSSLSASYEEVSFEDTWAQSPPSEVKGKSLPEFINEASDMQDYDAYHNCDDFRETYWQLYKKAPYVSPPNRKAWELAKTISKEDRDKGFARLALYKKWFEDTFLEVNTNNTLIIMPQEFMQPRYRDEVPNFERPPAGVNCLAIAAVLEAPALTIPIAEIPYKSRVTDLEEKLPFAVTVMGNAGTDLALMDTILTVLKDAGLPTTLKTGTKMF